MFAAVYESKDFNYSCTEQRFISLLFWAASTKLRNRSYLPELKFSLDVNLSNSQHFSKKKTVLNWDLEKSTTYLVHYDASNVQNQSSSVSWAVINRLNTFGDHYHPNSCSHAPYIIHVILCNKTCVHKLWKIYHHVELITVHVNYCYYSLSSSSASKPDHVCTWLRVEAVT